MPDLSEPGRADQPGAGGADQPGIGASKAQWREWMRKRRQNPSRQLAAAGLAAAHAEVVEALALFLQPRLEQDAQPTELFLTYSAIDSSAEVPLEPLADRFGWHHFALTRTPETGPLTIHPATATTEQHRFGFAQPVDGSEELPTNRITVALVPGLAFDRHGNRLGHGAGYYDELLARFSPDCLRVGVCLASEVVEQLPTDSHDIPMTHLATEHGVAALTV